MMNRKVDYHIPVLFEESIDALCINPDGVYVDATFGGGGHSRAIFENLSEHGKLIAFDQDQEAMSNAWEAKNFHFVLSNFSHLKRQLKLLGVNSVDGLFADFGVSSHQFDESKRGFSIRFDARLDMRMSKESALSAWHVVNEYSEEEIARVLYYYGDIKASRIIAKKIVDKRNEGEINSTFELMEIVRSFAKRTKESKFFAQIFQAIRIEVNQELQAIKDLLTQAAEVMKPNGRLVIISYHSLEDRLVKNYVKRGSFEGQVSKDFYGNILKPFDEIVRNPITPSEQEIQTNSRSRSAKLRIAKRNG